MTSRERSVKSANKIVVPFILTKIEENLSWKCWADNLLNAYDDVDTWIVGDLSGKIWAQSSREEFPVDECEIQRVVAQVNNQQLCRSTGITLAGMFYGFIQGNNINVGTFRSECGCVGVILLRNNFIIAVSNERKFPKNFYTHIHEAASQVKKLGY